VLDCVGIRSLYCFLVEMDGTVFIHRLVYTQDLNARLFRLHQGRQFFLEKSSDNLDTSSETVQNMSGRKRKVGKVVGFFL